MNHQRNNQKPQGHRPAHNTGAPRGGGPPKKYTDSQNQDDYYQNEESISGAQGPKRGVSSYQVRGGTSSNRGGSGRGAGGFNRNAPAATQEYLDEEEDYSTHTAPAIAGGPTGVFSKRGGGRGSNRPFVEKVFDDAKLNNYSHRGGKSTPANADYGKEETVIQVIRGKSRGAFQQAPRDGADYYSDRYGSSAQNQTEASGSVRGRGRGRGAPMHFVPDPNKDFYQALGQGLSSGRGIGGASIYVSTSSKEGGFDKVTPPSYQLYQFSQAFVPFQAPPQAPVPVGQNGNQWVGDFQNSAPFKPGQAQVNPQAYEKDINVEEEEEDEEEKSFVPQKHYSGNFRPSGQPGVLHYQKQPIQPHSGESRGKKDPSQASQFLTKYDHRNSIENINEEKVIQDKRSMNVVFGYKEWPQSEFFQGPQFVIFKEQSKIRNHKYPDLKEDDEQCYEVAPYPPRKEYRYLKDSKTSQNHKDTKDLPFKEERFDIRQEKRKGNKAWKELIQADDKFSKGPNGAKKGRAAGTAAPQGKENSKRKFGKDTKQKRGKNDKKRIDFEEYVQVEDEIKKGLSNGTFFEGLFRVNQNNRNRAFVTIDGMNVDVMVDGLGPQNRALDGDTVIVSLLAPTRWPPNTTSQLVIGGKMKLIGLTNDTAIETRVVDLERGVEAHQAPNGGGHQSKPHAHERHTVSPVQEKRPVVVEFESEKDSDGDADKAIDVEEAKIEVDDDDSSEGHGFEDDEVLDSDEEEISSEEEEEAPKKDMAKRPKQSKKPEDKPKQPIRQLQPSIDYQTNGKTRTQVLVDINELSKECRPIARVKAIIKSPNREKEHMVTLTILDQDRLDDESFLKMLQAHNDNEAKKDKKKGGKGDNTVISNKIAQNSGIYAVPISKKLPWMTISSIPQEFINDIQMGRKPKDRYYLARFESWNVGFIRPMCKITDHIGEAGDLKAESLRILKMNDVLTDEYEAEGQKISEKVIDSLKVFTKDLDPNTLEWMIPEEEIKIRLDLRKKRIFTIDPLTAKDLDDALSIDKINETIYEIGVHIADVSYFVQQGTELDKEAQLRCTSVYFVHKVYPMLPRLLCERLCSLNPQVDRLSYSIFFRMDMSTGEVDKSFTPKIARTVMRSCAKWNYQLVQDILDKKITRVEQIEEKYRPKEHSFDDMVKDCFLMHELAQKRRAKRFENGSIMLQNREFMFKLDQESLLPLSFEESRTRMPSKHLVEEYMLLANILIAEHLYQYCKDKTLLRAHPDLDNDKKTTLNEFYQKVGMGGEVDLTNSKSLSQSLELLRANEDQSKFNVAMRKFLTCLTCAKYMCINEAEPAEYQHYGLNFSLYTHFTSPIRRYADLLVHRLITLSLKHEEKTRDLIELMDYSAYADLCSEKSLAAKRASTACTRLFHCLLLKNQGQRVFETLVFDMDASSNLSIFIDEVNMHHKIHLRDDARIDSVIFFEEHMILAAHVKEIRVPAMEEKGKKQHEKQLNNGEKLDAFKQVKSLQELTGKDSMFAPEELQLFNIFDKVRVRVDTTTEFPLDIKCTLLFGPEDDATYSQLLAEQEAQKKQQAVRDQIVVSSSNQPANAARGAAAISDIQTSNAKHGSMVVSQVIEAENLDSDV